MKKRLIIFTVMAMMISLLAACSGSNEPNTGGSSGVTPPKKTETADNTKPAGKATVEFWHSLGGRNGELIDARVARFNELHDDIEVVATFNGSYDEMVTKLQQAVSAGTGPDLSMLERAYVQFFADSDVLEDLEPYLASSGLSLDYFTEGLLGHSVFNDKTVSLPLNRSTPILHVNKTMLDEAGLSIPKNWDELRDVANALVIEKNGEVERYGYTMVYDTWYPIAMITQANGKFFNDEKTSVGFVDNGVGLKVFSYLKEMQASKGLYYPPAQDSGSIVNAMFTEGKVGMLYQSTGSIGGLSKNADFDYVTAFLPANEVYANPTGGANISMMTDAKNKDAAWVFVEWMMTDPEGGLEFILESGYLPFTKEMVESDAIKELWAAEPARQVAYDQLQHAVDTNKDVNWPEVMHEFFSAIQAIMYDSEDIQSTLDKFEREAERILNQ